MYTPYTVLLTHALLDIVCMYVHVHSNDLRVVLDSEIGFALLFISTEEYCNPRATTSEYISLVLYVYHNCIQYLNTLY